MHTGVYKYPVDGARLVRRLNVDGDGQGDLAGHGGENRAVMVYQQESYDYWTENLKRDDLTPGTFGENFTISGLPDSEVCIGDRYRIGDATFEVTQPRVTCYRVGIRLGVAEMASLLVGHHRPGFYFRVIEEGEVQAGDSIVKVESGRHRLKVADIDALLYLSNRSHDMLKLAVDVPALSPGWQQSFKEILAAADAGNTIDANLVIGSEPAWPGFRPFTVVKTERATPSVLSVYLADKSGAALPAARPGQYLTLRLTVNGVAAVRSYSISAPPNESYYRISVKREDHGTVSRYIHDQLTVGTVVDVAAPRGEFVLDSTDEPVVLISAGIGISPVLAMLASIASTQRDRQVWWLHVSRTETDYALACEVETLLEQLPNARSFVWLTRAEAPRDQPVAGTTFGRLDSEGLRGLGFSAASSAYVCGPTAFNDMVTSSLIDIGIAPANVHSEIFSALSSMNPGVVQRAAVTPHAPAGAPGTGPAVTFARSGLTVNWSDQYQSLLELAEACDVSTRWSCRTGVCHTCITGLLSGDVEYSTEPLERPEPSNVLICVSQPTDETVLDA
ncbi:MOSC and FAD-binding oxidoreductase domain-containing protein [Lacisediminihabitans changchengi]|uniref:MOSC domain-containing protein n=1 Tax=Lacisediminihabitans changchengi TaxID=2787634 RepID=A0A934SLH2_9MICO|nr:MOSC and FAD-binding oxidoreductase domain-containing protein [Lacisediminihabitans changchengi]MBK4347127.1 MOSC domain-containing protein [Lacisediminihabitans changchengi]